MCWGKISHLNNLSVKLWFIYSLWSKLFFAIIEPAKGNYTNIYYAFNLAYSLYVIGRNVMLEVEKRVLFSIIIISHTLVWGPILTINYQLTFASINS